MGGLPSSCRAIPRRWRTRGQAWAWAAFPSGPATPHTSPAHASFLGLFSSKLKFLLPRYPEGPLLAPRASFPTALEDSCQDPEVVVSDHRPWQRPQGGFKFLFGTRHLK